MNTYEEYLKTAHWQAFRQKVLDFWKHRCCICYGTEKPSVHHRIYNLYKEELSDCVVLCDPCHSIVHVQMMPMGDLKKFREFSNATENISRSDDHYPEKQPTNSAETIDWVGAYIRRENLQAVSYAGPLREANPEDE